ncbi:MAG: Na+/H+ antiporter [Chitinophagaceae bacterium]|nr:MAG: Na+/H+ antiporter [Chitinophagaceae bacterium]
MIDHFPLYIAMLIAIVLLIMLANKIKVAYPVLLVIAGLLISFIPGMPVLHVNPELIFIIFLPPLLYEAAWSISWKELWKWRRIIGSFAFVVVFITALTVAYVANTFIPGFSLALGFLLGGIVSPPDAVSAGAILKFVKVPKRMSSILEGESLLNDASSLIIFRFALIAVATGQFIWSDALMSFGWMLVGGTGIGLLVGWVFMKAHKRLPTDVNMDIVFTIIAPYVMYIAAEEVHASGILAVVGGGLFLSTRRHQFLNSTARLQSVNVWQSLVFVLNGIVFLLIGLELPEITAGLEGVALSTAVFYGLLVTGVLIITRIISAYGAVVVTLIARNFITVADTRNPGAKVPLILGWTGMRGVVSLAAALSIPVKMADGTDFPQRNLILFITFIAILTTLVLQGLTLPLLIRWLGIPENDDYKPEAELDFRIRKGMAQQSIQYLNKNYAENIAQYPVLKELVHRWERFNDEESARPMPPEAKKIYLDLLEFQRKYLISKNHDYANVDEDVIRKHLRQVDIEEEKLKIL